jgi:hypothetical protein
MSAQPTYPPSLRLADPLSAEERAFVASSLLARHAERIAAVSAIRLEAVRALAEERYLDLGEIGRRLHQAADVRDRAAATLRKHGIETDQQENSR